MRDSRLSLISSIWQRITNVIRFSRFEKIEHHPTAIFGLTSLAWDQSDRWVITAGNIINIWDSRTGVLLKTLVGHEHFTSVILNHPLDFKVGTRVQYTAICCCFNLCTKNLLALCFVDFIELRF